MPATDYFRTCGPIPFWIRYHSSCFGQLQIQYLSCFNATECVISLDTSAFSLQKELLVLKTRNSKYAYHHINISTESQKFIFPSHFIGQPGVGGARVFLT